MCAHLPQSPQSLQAPGTPLHSEDSDGFLPFEPFDAALDWEEGKNRVQLQSQTQAFSLLGPYWGFSVCWLVGLLVFVVVVF